MRSSSAIVTVLVRGAALSDFARGGAAVVAVWMAAQDAGLTVQPMSPPFLYAHTGTELGELSGKYADELRRLQDTFHALTSKGPDGRWSSRSNIRCATSFGTQPQEHRL